MRSSRSSGAIEHLMLSCISLLFIISHPGSSENPIFGLGACEDIQIFGFHCVPLACSSKHASHGGKRSQ